MKKKKAKTKGEILVIVKALITRIYNAGRRGEKTAGLYSALIKWSEALRG